MSNKGVHPPDSKNLSAGVALCGRSDERSTDYARRWSGGAAVAASTMASPVSRRSKSASLYLMLIRKYASSWVLLTTSNYLRASGTRRTNLLSTRVDNCASRVDSLSYFECIPSIILYSSP